MYKELIISIIIVVAVFSLEAITQGYTKRSGDDMINLLSELKSNALNEDKEGIKNNLPIDMIEIDIKNMIDLLGQITGKTYQNDGTMGIGWVSSRYVQTN